MSRSLRPRNGPSLRDVVLGIPQNARRWEDRARGRFDCRPAEKLTATIVELVGSDGRLLCTLGHLARETRQSVETTTHALGVLQGAGLLDPIRELDFAPNAPNGWRLVGWGT